jgi:AraC-like DNA-binding protein
LLLDEVESLNRLYNIAGQAGCGVLIYDFTDGPDSDIDQDILVHDIAGPRLVVNSDICAADAITNDNVGPDGLDGGVAGAGRGLSPLAAPVFDFNGSLAGFLDITPSGGQLAGCPSVIARSVIQTTARAIEERSFRRRHDRDWIVALLPPDKVGSGMLLAVDRRQYIVGADRPARATLLTDTAIPESGLPLSMLFETQPMLFRSERAADVPGTLIAVNGKETWPALVTPPLPAGYDRHDHAHAVAHTRPRLDSIGYFCRSATSAPARGGLPPHALRRVYEYIEANLKTSIVIENLAKIADLSRFHFARAFKESTGSTPHGYVMYRRMAKAQELLAETDIPVAEVAILTGFSDQSHLCRRFIKHFGTAPSLFRKSHR